jgi:hypothetical protein
VILENSALARLPLSDRGPFAYYERDECSLNFLRSVEAAAMKQLTLEQRVAALEQQVAEMKAQQSNGVGKNDWKQTVGKFPELQEVFAEAMKVREADRKKARRGPSKAARGKS